LIDSFIMIVKYYANYDTKTFIILGIQPKRNLYMRAMPKSVGYSVWKHG